MEGRLGRYGGDDGGGDKIFHEPEAGCRIRVSGQGKTCSTSWRIYEYGWKSLSIRIISRGGSLYARVINYNIIKYKTVTQYIYFAVRPETYCKKLKIVYNHTGNARNVKLVHFANFDPNLVMPGYGAAFNGEKPG